MEYFDLEKKNILMKQIWTCYSLIAKFKVQYYISIPLYYISNPS